MTEIETDYRDQDRDGHHLVSRLTGETITVQVRRRLVDATYLESAVPARHTPAFTVDADVRLVTPTGLVDPDRIRWVRPRDPWIIDRAYYQPRDQVTTFVEGQARQVEAAAMAEDVDDLLRRLEASGQLIRLDPTVEPAMLHMPSLSTAELADLRRIERVVRQGRVQRVGAREMVLEHGTMPITRDQAHVDCTASGLRLAAGGPTRRGRLGGRPGRQRLGGCLPAQHRGRDRRPPRGARDDLGDHPCVGALRARRSQPRPAPR